MGIVCGLIRVTRPDEGKGFGHPQGVPLPDFRGLACCRCGGGRAPTRGAPTGCRRVNLLAVRAGGPGTHKGCPYGTSEVSLLAVREGGRAPTRGAPTELPRFPCWRCGRGDGHPQGQDSEVSLLAVREGERAPTRGAPTRGAPTGLKGKVGRSRDVGVNLAGFTHCGFRSRFRARGLNQGLMAGM